MEGLSWDIDYENACVLPSRKISAPFQWLLRTRWFANTSWHLLGTRDHPSCFGSEQNSKRLYALAGFTRASALQRLGSRDAFSKQPMPIPFIQGFPRYVVIERELFIKPWWAETRPPRALAKEQPPSLLKAQVRRPGMTWGFPHIGSTGFLCFIPSRRTDPSQKQEVEPRHSRTGVGKSGLQPILVRPSS